MLLICFFCKNYLCSN